LRDQRKYAEYQREYRRKPSWLARITKHGNLSKLVARKCDGCKRWTIQCRENVWESYDAGIIAGDDLTIAIILGKPLVRIRRIPGLDQISLLSTFGAAGIAPQGEYLALHDCTLGVISSRPLTFPKHVDHADEMIWPNVTPLPDSTDPWAAKTVEKELMLL
jgi:hypothetical protein